MQYTDLTRKELQREYDRVARKYTNLLREPLALDMTVQDPLLGQSSSQRAVRHFGTVLGKELSDTGAAHPHSGGRCRGSTVHDAGLRPPHGGAVPPGGRLL